jgi:hypothetical protein
MQVTEHPPNPGAPIVADHSFNAEACDENGRLDHKPQECLEPTFVFRRSSRAIDGQGRRYASLPPARRARAGSRGVEGEAGLCDGARRWTNRQLSAVPRKTNKQLDDIGDGRLRPQSKRNCVSERVGPLPARSPASRAGILSANTKATTKHHTTKIPHIQASPRGADSKSNEIARARIETLRRHDPRIIVDTIDLWREPLPEFEGNSAAAKMSFLWRRWT